MRLSLLSALLPALLPSWRFFDRIGPAPHVEYSWGAAAVEAGRAWRPLRPEPAHVALGTLLARLLWNPERNEALFLVSCAERLLEDPSAARADLLWRRVADLIRQERIGSADAADSRLSGYLRVRIVEVTREGHRLARAVRYVSEARPLPGPR